MALDYGAYYMNSSVEANQTWTSQYIRESQEAVLRRALQRLSEASRPREMTDMEKVLEELNGPT